MTHQVITVEAKSQICFFKMFTESEQWKKTMAAKMMNGFDGLCIFYLLIAFRKQSNNCGAMSPRAESDQRFELLQAWASVPNKHFPNGVDYSVTTEGHLEVLILAAIVDFLFALSETVFKFTPVFDSLFP